MATPNFAIELRKCNRGYPNSVVNAGITSHKMENNFKILFILALHPQNYEVKSVIIRKM